ncbi:DUF3693 domain-containing protein [Vibrio sp. 16]|uniref:DUF3693 domain-containing protein n=1 Tax=Vibrio sp. 16 TaxID=391586 RepID=UPI00018F2ECC|nr:DUF3693 domain-containing protein [Vibrio sp. 16]EED26343.1 bacteriophage f237 ORF10 [Vibrio sp. 16]CAK4075878.1 hypothetical protein VDT1_4272 [Vibrio sp. 16]
MYTEKLLDAYKEHMNYIQYKQVASDLGISNQMLTDIRKGRAFLKENLALMIAEQIGEDQESVLIGLAADKAKTPQEQALWANIAKKFNGLNLHGISIACVGLAMWIGSPSEAIAQCVLCTLC